MPHNASFPLLTDLFAEGVFSVEELFKQLSYQELSNLAVAVDSTGTLKPERHNQVIHLANEGLRALHVRFELIQSDEVLTIPVADHEFEQLLAPDIIQPVSILTAMGGSLTFHKHPVPGEIYVYNRTLSFPPTTLAYEVQVVYQKRHPILNPIEQDTDLQQPITLVPELRTALRAYIAAEVFGGINTPEATAASIKHQARYQQTCIEVSNSGVLSQQMLNSTKSDKAGWV